MIDILILLATCTISIFLGLFAFMRNRKSATSWFFLVLVLSMVIWSIFNFLSYKIISPENALFLTRSVLFTAVIFAFFFFIFVYVFPNSKFVVPKKVLLPIVLLGIICLVLIPTGLVFKEIRFVGEGYQAAQPVVNPGIAIFALAVVVFNLGGLIVLGRKIFRSRGTEKRQRLFLFVGFAVMLALIVVFNFIMPSVFGNASYIPLASTFILIFVGFTSYAIIAQRLFDIRAAVARSVAFVLAAVLIGLVYGFGAFGIIHIFVFGNQQALTLAEQTVYVLLAIVLAFTFGPILRGIEKVTDRIFYRDKYDPQKLVNETGRIMAGEIHLDELCQKVVNEIKTTMKISEVEIVVFGDEKVHFQTRVFGTDHQKIIIEDLKKLGRLITLKDNLSGGDKKAVLDKYNFSASLSLRTSENFLGYILLGEKKSGDIYSSTDVRTLKIIANELSVAVQNAKAFAEIEQFNVTLQEKVEQATRSLRNANVQLKELDQAKDEFISMASHQLRTPLTTIKGYVSMLDEGDFGKLSKEQKEYVELALDGSNRMARLIGDLLDVSRMEAGKFFIDAQKIDLNTIVPQEIDQLQSMADSKKVDLRYVKPKKPIPIMNLDENKTRQVLMNLADNAIHYSAPPKGGGKVEIRLERDGEDIVYVVRDNGIGVPKDQQGKLFTKMFRAKNAQEVRPDGTGLGLYLVKRVVEDQGGKLIFESTPGKGSVFGFRMPIHNKIVIDKKAQQALMAAQVGK